MSWEHPIRLKSSVMGSMVWFIGLVILLLPHVEPVKAAAAPKRILALYWYNKDFSSNIAFDRSLQAVLKSAPAGSIEYYTEYLESDRFPGENQSEALRDYLRQKYATRSIDVVVAVSDVPLEFLLKYRDSLFTKTPIVFIAIKRPATNETSGPGLTGIVLGGGYKKTVDLALRLHPDTKQVFIISGTLNHDRTYETLCREELQGLDSGISINYFTDLSVDELIFKTKTLPEKSLVLYIWQQSQNEGRLLESADILSAIAPLTTAPIYGVADWQVGHGVVGGYLRTFEGDGTRVGEIALRIANGARAQDIPIESASRAPIFDWGQLHRWDLKESALPPGSVVLNREPTVWELFHWYILAGLALILVEGLLIFALVWQRATRRKVEAELGFTYDRLRLAMASGKSVAWDLDVKTGQNRWFGDLKTMFGIQSETFSGSVDDFRRRTYPDDRELISKAIEDARKERAPYSAEFRVIREDGAFHWVAARGKFYYAHNGDAERMLGIASDVTDRKQAENAVQESEGRFRLIANAAPVMIWMSDTDKLCDYCNLPWLEFTGRTLEQELGNGWSESVHPDDLREYLDTYVQAFDRREPFRMQYRLRRHDGEYRWLLDIGVPRFAPDGSFAGYIGSCLDITERKVAEEAMASLSRRLLEAQEQERTWIARELHDDINQQIALLSVELEQWDKQSPKSASDFHTHIRHATGRLSDIGRNIQALSHRLHSSKLEYLGLVKAADSFCREISDRQKVHVEFSHSDIPRTMPKEIALCLFRVLQEALQNAVKHSGARQFHVELRGAPGAISLTVIDQGVGFDWHGALDRQGLGLISMRERLQLVNGEFHIESEHGQGTTIHARVPLRAQERHLSMAG